MHSWCPTARTRSTSARIGTVGMICAWRLPGARFVTVEARRQRRARKKISVTTGLGTATKSAKVISAMQQFSAQMKNSISSLAARRIFPRARLRERASAKLACRFELRGTIADYCATAAKQLASGGFFACVSRTNPPSLPASNLLQRFRLVIVRKRPVVFAKAIRARRALRPGARGGLPTGFGARRGRSRI